MGRGLVRRRLSGIGGVPLAGQGRGGQGSWSAGHRAARMPRARAYISGTPGKDGSGGEPRIGLWGFGAGALEVLRAAGDGRAAFVVLAPDAVGEGASKVPDTAGLERVQAPVLLVFFSRETAREWEKTASGLRGQGTEVDVVVLSPSGAVAASGERSVEDVAGRMFAVLGAALPWSLDKTR